MRRESTRKGRLRGKAVRVEHMRVLFIPSRYPQDLRRGDELRAYQHLRELAKRHAITVLAFAPPGLQSGVDEEIRRLCERVVIVRQTRYDRLMGAVRALPASIPLQAAMNDTPAFRSTLSALLSTSAFDIAHLQLARMGEALPLLDRLPVVLDLIDALSANMARRADYDAGPMRWLAAIEAKRLLPYERGLCARVACATVSSMRDRAALGDDLPMLHIVANGVDPDEFAFSTELREPDTLVFSGNLGYFPNVDAAIWFVHEVLPLLRAKRPGVEIHLVGARPAAALRRLAQTQPGVRLIGPIADMRIALSRAAVAVAPMRAGSGQQIKILEAMSCGTPVVATSVAAAGLEAVPGRDLLVGSDAPAFADAVAQLLGDRAFADRLSRNARNLIEQRYTWKQSALAVEWHWKAVAEMSANVKKRHRNS